MTLHWRTCFDAVVIGLAVLLTPALHAGKVDGQVALLDSHQVTSRHKDASGVVVWLWPLGPDPDPRPPQHVRMIQKGKRFEPHILAIDVGTRVDFPNFDPIFHNAFSNFNGQLFDIGLYAPGSSKSILFKREGIVRVFCNIHPTMSAAIVVLNSPYFGTTDKKGRYTIASVPRGEYELRVFDERATPETLSSLRRPVTVPGSEIQIPVLKISEAGYVATPHKNKYGRDYPPDAGDDSGYSHPTR